MLYCLCLWVAILFSNTTYSMYLSSMLLPFIRFKSLQKKTHYTLIRKQTNINFCHHVYILHNARHTPLLNFTLFWSHLGSRIISVFLSWTFNCVFWLGWACTFSCVSVRDFLAIMSNNLYLWKILARISVFSVFSVARPPPPLPLRDTYPYTYEDYIC